MAESHGRHIRMQALRCGKRQHQCRDLRVDPELVIKRLKQLQPWRELPSKLPENFVLLVCSWKLGVGAGLAVEIAQILISRKKPDSITTHRTAEIRCEVTVFDAFVSTERGTARHKKANRLTGQAGPLAVVRRVIQETIAPCFCDDVEHGALNVAVLG